MIWMNINMAVSTLVRLSEDKIIRHAYQRRQDDIMLAAKRAYELEQEKRRADRAEAENEQLKRQLAELLLQLNKN